jgi:hypothetical protein
MRVLATMALLALLAACRSEAPAPANTQDAAQPGGDATAPASNEAVLVLKRSDPALDAMSPRQRRAYERGLADCRAGRYEPANHPEAYRIGCAAAHDR